jgi:single-strand DNA-binding protein
MKSSLKNSVRLLGNLGANPEVREFAGGKKLVKLNLATNENYKDADGNKVTETQWHNAVAWGRTAEFAEKYLEKGSEIAIEGRLVNRSYTDKEGVKKFITEIHVDEILPVAPKKKA